MEVNESMFVKDIWGVIITHANLYDTIFIRASSTSLYRLCKQFRPFPKYHVLDQDKCMAYLIQQGSTSCLDYVKNTLHFEWTSKQSLVAVEYGQVAVLQHLCAHGCPFTEPRALRTCTKGTCSLDMIKYLIERGNTWHADNPNDAYIDYMSDMATRGHLDCIKYAMETGCTDRTVHYTPSMACLEFFVEHQFDFKSPARRGLSRRSVCEYAAQNGNLTMLQYAHQHGAPFEASGFQAVMSGHLECLKYVMDHSDYVPNFVVTVDCFKYLLDKFGREELFKKLNWAMVTHASAELLKYMIESGITLPMTSYTLVLLLSSSTISCNRDTLKLIFDYVPAEKMSQICAGTVSLHCVCAREGYIEALKILFERNMPIGAKIDIFFGNAVLSGKIDVVKLVWENLLPNKEMIDINNRHTLHKAMGTTPEIVAFLVEQGAKLTSKHLAEATSNDNLPIVAYLTRLGYQSNDVGKPHSMCTKYLREHNTSTKMEK